MHELLQADNGAVPEVDLLKVWGKLIAGRRDERVASTMRAAKIGVSPIGKANVRVANGAGTPGYAVLCTSKVGITR